MYLLDTNIVSAGAPDKKAVGQEAFAEWLRDRRDHLYLSTVTIAEVEAGIRRAERIEAHAKASRLKTWLTAIEALYAGRILSFDAVAAREAGRIIDLSRAHAPGFADIAIAATAAAHGLTVLTANERHFVGSGIVWRNPFVELPADGL